MVAGKEIGSGFGWQKIGLPDLVVENAWTIERILDRAHQIHRERGGMFGYDLEDWLQAERELADTYGTSFESAETLPAKVQSVNERRF